MTHHQKIETPNNAMMPVVRAAGENVFANSRDVVAYFDKRHTNVLAAIREPSKTLTAEKSAVWFRPSTFMQKTGFGEREMPCYHMTRDGFTILVMGFTGKQSTVFKVQYIDAFNAMEAEIKRGTSVALPDFSDPAAAAEAWANQYRQREQAQALIEEQKPMVLTAQIMGSHVRPVMDVAGRLPGVNRQKVQKRLHELGYLCKPAGAQSYRVRSRFRDKLLGERLNPDMGTAVITVLDKGLYTMAKLYNEGQFTLKRGEVIKPIDAKTPS